MGSKWSRLPLLVRWGFLGLTAAGVLVLVTVALWRIPWWLDDHYLDEDLTPAQGTTVSGLRTALVALGAGLLVAAGLIYTHHTLHLSREGQVTDRFKNAIDQIASTRPLEQLGGIYSLERIMRDSAKDRPPIVEVLASFIREHAPFAGDAKQTEHHPTDADGRRVPPRPCQPVQAALTVLGRRPRDRDESFFIDLRKTDLRGADLSGAHLERACLDGADMRGTNLMGTHLEEAWMHDTLLTEARLLGTNLNGASLRNANLDAALLSDVKMKGTWLSEAHLKNAWGLTLTDLMAALPTSSTELPAGLSADDRVKARIAQGDMEEEVRLPFSHPGWALH
ncbi:pentapeptide repeat protein [Streptomyces sp. SLBN-118]|uniref:pentapeptide repeat-containing protein n=1 Tax=Streptomyces sp. SLBN-118 TaxID=2768454 RepID=UPI0011517DC4|nr:pentapeptide repeat-containing protein [Streptomyces sp. SLBN-118]TQK52045.1 pentapeptide repeat protein [Streptomyces sp. SLBN-118]